MNPRQNARPLPRRTQRERRELSHHRMLDAALTLNPRDALALYGRGLARRLIGDQSAGERDIAAATLLRPTIAEDIAEYGFAAP